MKYGKKLMTLGVGLATSVALLAGPSAAFATEATPEPTVAESEVGMVLESYDSEVAAANGYEIITNADGTQASIPVTEETIAFEAALLAEQSGARYTRVDGPCGWSWINVTNNGNHKTVTSGYTVPRAVISKTWQVQMIGWAGISGSDWKTGPSNPTWEMIFGVFYNGGGFANVTPGSNVVMNNGSVCSSGSPGENF
jgi:hypothetical protein